MTDDVGFGATSAFGGPVATPNFDSLARLGLRYNQFNTTALCGPTRAALLTGRNSHHVHMGNVEELSTGFEGYDSVIPKSAATIAQILKDNGYNTAMIGKANVTPEWEQSAAGPFDRWPTGLGFEYYYGFLHTDTDQFAPDLVENTVHVDPSAGNKNYILDEDLANKAISWIAQHNAVEPSKPFFMYYATGSTHAPHQAPASWLMKFRGKFHEGWDVLREEIFARQKRLGVIPANALLTRRPPELRPWDSLTPDERRVQERFMEAYAAELAFCDYQVGRVIDYLKKTGQFDNTLIVYIEGDNGPAAEAGPPGELFQQSSINSIKEDPKYVLDHIDDIGGPRAYNLYSAEWAWSLATPFQWFKQVASHFGGTRNGLVISWPKGIKDHGGLRPQYSYVTDIAPTILDVTGIAPERSVNGVPQIPFDGVSLKYTFNSASAPARHHVQYTEIFENLGIYADGWMAGTRPERMPWQLKMPQMPLEKRTWELYHVTNDFSQAKDLAATEPQKLRQMQELFFSEARKNNVLPLHFAQGSAGRPSLGKMRTVFEYPTPVTDIPEDAAPPVLNRSFTVSADIDVQGASANGVLIAQGGRFGGYSLYVVNGVPAFCYNSVPPHIAIARGEAPLSAGHHLLSAYIHNDGGRRGAPATITLSVDGKVVGSARIDVTLSNWLSKTESFDIGVDKLTPVSDDYQSPFAFNGQINLIKITLN